ncbi:LysR family transcriptional regulator [Geminisphaera colitermitum]|uniref:LysR family transcriptional regulator n=1 Tax=Geminisphaera colitermitum TaxID=1148786 RepID=UPI000158C7B1|nr:LysR family transcriptional regulator [Geminisphaera colitermitum]
MQPVIESHQLRLYVMLARLLNMSRVANELRMTPSAVSHALKAMEADLGCVLFERTSRSMKLTPAGEALLPEAQAILAGMESLRARAGAIADPGQRRVRIGASTTACQFILPPVLREFRESFPDHTIRIEPCTARQAADSIAADRIDFAVTLETPGRAGLEFRFLAADTLQFIVHPLHPWAIKRHVPREEVPDGKFIISEADEETYALIEDYFRKEKLTLKPFIEIANEEAIKRFVNLDMGVGILPRWVVASEIERGHLTALPLGRRQLRRRWGLLYAKGRNLNFAESLFFSICREVMHSLVSQDGEEIAAKAGGAGE